VPAWGNNLGIKEFGAGDGIDLHSALESREKQKNYRIILTIQSCVEIYQDYSAESRLLSSSSREHSGSSLALFRHPAQLWRIIDSIYHHDSEVLAL
jgi:hypothetical protein